MTDADGRRTPTGVSTQMWSKWWVALVPAMALAGGACSKGLSSNGPGGGGHAPAGSAGTHGMGGTDYVADGMIDTIVAQ